MIPLWGMAHTIWGIQKLRGQEEGCGDSAKYPRLPNQGRRWSLECPRGPKFEENKIQLHISESIYIKLQYLLITGFKSCCLQKILVGILGWGGFRPLIGVFEISMLVYLRWVRWGGFGIKIW